MSAWGLRGRSSTNNLGDLKYLFELHVCFYFNCDLYTKTVMDENTLVPQHWARINGGSGRGKTYVYRNG
jgi:hypothetical protein